MKLIMETWRRYLVEGGNVFAGQNVAPIPLENIRPTLDAYYAELNKLFPDHAGMFKGFNPVGSVGKKEESGDIDLVVDVKDMFESKEVTPEEMESWNVHPEDWQVTFNKYKKRARRRTDAQIGWRAFLTELGKYINDNSDLIIVDMKKIGHGTMFSLFPQFDPGNNQLNVGVQIDWMVGNREWLSFAYFSDHPSQSEPMTKGLHRTQLILAMFLAKNHSFSHTDGVRDKETDEIVARTPEDALRLLGDLYDGEVTSENLYNFHNLYKWLEKNASKDMDKAIDAYLVILDRTNGNKEKDPVTGRKVRCGYIPKVLEDYWLENWKRLNLRGKFLCRDANAKLWSAVNES